MNSPLPGYMPGEEQAHYRHEAGVVTLPPSYSSTTFEPITSQPGPIPIEQFGTPYGLQGPDTVAYIPYGLGYLSTIDTIVVFRVLPALFHNSLRFRNVASVMSLGILLRI